MNQVADAGGTIREKLNTYAHPYLGQTLGEAKAVQSVTLRADSVGVELVLGFPCADYGAELAAALEGYLVPLLGQHRLELKLRAQITAHAVQRTLKPLANVKNIVAVASGKGGVGKSTTAANLALALSREGARVGILDADIYGPSQGVMFGIAEGTRPKIKDQKWFVPIEAHGIEVMSMAFLTDDNTPMVWRGPMVSGALLQLIKQTAWNDLDYLVIDMPPGTGDIQLTLAQKVPVAGAVIVTTPQDLALLDAKKGVEMFRKVNIPVLGVVENMAVHICSNCGHAEHLFRSEE